MGNAVGRRWQYKVPSVPPTGLNRVQRSKVPARKERRVPVPQRTNANQNRKANGQRVSVVAGGTSKVRRRVQVRCVAADHKQTCPAIRWGLLAKQGGAIK